MRVRASKGRAERAVAEPSSLSTSRRSIKTPFWVNHGLVNESHLAVTNLVSNIYFSAAHSVHIYFQSETDPFNLCARFASAGDSKAVFTLTNVRDASKQLERSRRSFYPGYL